MVDRNGSRAHGLRYEACIGNHKAARRSGAPETVADEVQCLSLGKVHRNGCEREKLAAPRSPLFVAAEALIIERGNP